MDIQGANLLFQLIVRRYEKTSTASLLYHMGNIFQEQRQPFSGGVRVTVDSKLKRKIREKKIAMGHKPDDHEDQEQTM